MKTFYCVASAYDDRGRAIASLIGSMIARDIPTSTRTSDNRRDIYLDWFPSERRALAFIEKCKAA